MNSPGALGWADSGQLQKVVLESGITSYGSPTNVDPTDRAEEEPRYMRMHGKTMSKS
jgi:hypothetical protein